MVNRGDCTAFLTGRVARFLFRRPRGRRGQNCATFGREPSAAVRGIVRVRGRAGQGGRGRRCRRRRSSTARTFVGLSRLRGRRGHGRRHVVGRRQPGGDQRFGRGLEVGDLVVVVVVVGVTVRVAAVAADTSFPYS